MFSRFPLAWAVVPAFATLLGASSRFPVKVGRRRRWLVRLGHVVLAMWVLAGCNSDTASTPDLPVLAMISISQSPSLSLYVGQSSGLSAIVVDDRGVPTAAHVAWSSDRPVVATVDAVGTVTAASIGTTTIRARVGQLSASTVVTVGPRIGLLVAPDGEFGDTILLTPGQSIRFSSLEYDRATSTLLDSVQSPSWSSTAPDVATVSAGGLVTAVAEGNADVTVAADSQVARRVIRVARMVGTTSLAGTMSLRLVNADQEEALNIRANTGEPLVSLGYGDVNARVVGAGTLYVTVDGFSTGRLSNGPLNYYSPTSGWAVQSFLGLLLPGTGLTLVASHDPIGFTLAPLWDWNGPIAPDSAMVRLLLASSGGFNVFFADPGAPPSIIFLQACYLDFPYGVADYAARAAKPFDIVLTQGKVSPLGSVAARFTVTPQAGTATTYVISGQTPADFRLLAIVDPR